MQTCPCNEDPLTLYFSIVKLGLTGVYIFFLISAPKQRLWVFVGTVSVPTMYVLSKNRKQCPFFHLDVIIFNRF